MLYFTIQWQSVQKSVAVGISQLPRVKFRSSDIVEGWERAVQRNEIVGKKINCPSPLDSFDKAGKYNNTSEQRNNS